MELRQGYEEELEGARLEMMHMEQAHEAELEALRREMA